MNIFLVAVLVIIFGLMIWGYWRGFIRITFSLILMVLNIMLVSWVTPYITNFLKENTSIYNNMVERYVEVLQISAEEEINKTFYEKEKNIKGEELLQDIQLPELWMEEILGTVDSASQFIGKEQVYRQVGEHVADWILRGVTFALVFLLNSLLLKVLLSVFDIVARLPLLKGINRFLGGAVGFVQGLLIVWLLLFLVTIFCTTQIGRVALAYINESKLLTYLYQYNGIVYLFYYVFV